MKIQWSGIGITEGRGKIGGNVLSRNGSGAYARKNTAPVQPNSPAQQAVKALFAFISNGWKVLTDAQRQGWNDATSNFPQTDSMGIVTILSGFQLFSKLNNSILQLNVPGVAGLVTAPTPGLIYSPTSVALAIDGGLGTYDVTLGEAVPADQAVGVYITMPLSTGKNNFENELVLLQSFDSASGPVLDISMAYIARFGVVPSGSKVGVTVQGLNKLTGQRGVEVKSSTIGV